MTHPFAASWMVIAFVMLIAGTAHAEKSQSLRGGYCDTSSSDFNHADVVWNCEHIGKVVIRQIYEKGFRVVGVFSDQHPGKPFSYRYLIIEELRK